MQSLKTIIQSMWSKNILHLKRIIIYVLIKLIGGLLSFGKALHQDNVILLFDELSVYIKRYFP